MADRDFERQMQGFSLTTAEILYRLPDYPALLQSYVWQEYDLHPHYPKLRDFLEFWRANIDGLLFGVRVGHAPLIHTREFAFQSGSFRLQ